MVLADDSKRFEPKHRGKLGPSRYDTKTIRILNRIVELTEAGIFYDGDETHAEICIDQMGLKKSMREVMTPVDRQGKDPTNANSLGMKEQGTQPPPASAATMYREMTARMNCLGQDRSENQFAVKELRKEMSSPNQGSWLKFKGQLRYLKSNPRCRQLFDYQQQERNVPAWSDSGFAGCTESRESSSARVIRLGNHTITAWTINQAVLALSSGEAEYYALLKSASVAI